MVTMQCKEKRNDILIILVKCFTVVLAFHLINNILSFLWGCEHTNPFWFKRLRRKVSSLIKELREDVKEEKGGLVETTGKDFLFVFDLLAQTCGKAATLRVLSFSATSFEDLCQPELKGVIEKKEKWIRVTWQPARLESARKQKLEIRTYIATIFPVGRAGGGEDTWRARQAAAGEAVEFDGLAGGTQEYILTISAIFKDTKLKGTRVRFNLPPYPPQKLSCVAGACEEEPQRGQVEVSWAPPRGDHCKYKLLIAPLKKQLVMEPRLSRTSNSSKTSTKEGEGRTVWLPKGSVSHEARDLDPGEMFLLTLSSMTSSSEECRRPVLQAFLTPPLPPSNVEVAVEGGGLLVSWVPPPPPGHSFLASYRATIRRSGQEKPLWEQVIPRFEPGTNRPNTKEMLELEEGVFVAGEYVCSLVAIATGREPQPATSLPNRVIRAESRPVERSFAIETDMVPMREEEDVVLSSKIFSVNHVSRKSSSRTSGEGLGRLSAKSMSKVNEESSSWRSRRTRLKTFISEQQFSIDHSPLSRLESID